MIEVDSSEIEKVNQERIHELLFSEELSWQAIIYDLINTEQLDPWDIDITILVAGFLEKIQKLEEADFFVSGKILLAATLLHKLKSDFLLNKHLKDLDEILMGKKQEEPTRIFERIEINQDEIPLLVPKTPMPRFRKVTLEELMKALNKAINTENRRIKKEVQIKQAEKQTQVSLPKRKITLHNHVRIIYKRIQTHLQGDKTKTEFHSLLEKKDKEEKIMTFISLLHLDGQEKIWLEQQDHFKEIQVWLNHVYKEHNPEVSEIEDDYVELK